MKLLVKIAALSLPWVSSVFAQNQTQIPVDPGTAGYSQEQLSVLLRSALKESLQGITTIHYEKETTFSLDQAKERWRKKGVEISKMMKETPQLVLTEAEKLELAHEPTSPEVQKYDGEIVLEFQDFNKWRLTSPATEISGSLYVVADGSSFVFQHQQGIEGTTVFSGDAVSVFGLHTHDFLPWAKLIPLVVGPSASFWASQKWSFSPIGPKSISCKVIGEEGGEALEASFEVATLTGGINQVSYSLGRINQSTWTCPVPGEWNCESVVRDESGKTIFTEVVKVRVTQKIVTAFPVSTFSPPFKVGDKVRFGPAGNEIDLPAEAFIEGKIKFDDLQKTVGSGANDSALEDSVDEAAQRIEDIKTLPPEVKKPLQDAADGAKKLLQGAETAPQESAPVTPQ